MKKHKICIIGCGVIGKAHADVIKRLENAILGGFYDTKTDFVKQVEKKYNNKTYLTVDEVINDETIDIINICVPSSLHCDLAVKCANAGKNIIVEKPIDITMEKADKIMNECEKNSVSLCCVLQHRLDKDILKAKQVIESGKLGKLLLGTCNVKWHRDQDYYDKSGWRGTWKYDGGGALINQSIHTIDLLIYLMDSSVKYVWGNCKTLGHKNIETEDIGLAMIEFENGAIGSIEGSTISYPPIGTFLEIQGTKGHIIFREDCIYEMIYDGMEEGDIHSNREDNINRIEPFLYQSHLELFKNFIEHLDNNKPLIIQPKQATEALKVILGIYESSSKKKMIELT